MIVTSKVKLRVAWHLRRICSTCLWGAAGKLRAYVACPSWCSCLWEIPRSWAHITDDKKIFNVVETWVWAGLVLGKTKDCPPRLDVHAMLITQRVACRPPARSYFAGPSEPPIAGSTQSLLANAASVDAGWTVLPDNQLPQGVTLRECPAKYHKSEPKEDFPKATLNEWAEADEAEQRQCQTRGTAVEGCPAGAAADCSRSTSAPTRQQKAVWRSLQREPGLGTPGSKFGVQTTGENQADVGQEKDLVAGAKACNARGALKPVRQQLTNSRRHLPQLLLPQVEAAWPPLLWG
eukprot:6455593-Amphidinium_carterae.3